MALSTGARIFWNIAVPFCDLYPYADEAFLPKFKVKTVSNGWFRDANLVVTAGAIYSNIFQFLRGHILFGEYVSSSCGVGGGADGAHGDRIKITKGNSTRETNREVGNLSLSYALYNFGATLRVHMWRKITAFFRSGLRYIYGCISVQTAHAFHLLPTTTIHNVIYVCAEFYTAV